MFVGVARDEDVVLGPIASLSHPNARFLEIFEREDPITGGKGGRFWVILDHFYTSPLETWSTDVCEDDHLTNEYAPGAAGCHRAFPLLTRVISTRAFAPVPSGARLLRRCIKWAATVSSFGDLIV